MKLSDVVFVADAEREPDIPAPRAWGDYSLGFQRVVLGLQGLSWKDECSDFITSFVNCSREPRRGCGDNFIAINCPAKICESEWGSFITQHQTWTDCESTDRWSGSSISQCVRNGDEGATTIENERTLNAYAPRDVHPRAMRDGELEVTVTKLFTDNYELIDAGCGENARESHDEPIGQARVFKHFVKSHRFSFFILSLGLSICATFCLTFGIYFAVRTNSVGGILLYIGLAMLLFAMVFAFAHWSYE